MGKSLIYGPSPCLYDIETESLNDIKELSKITDVLNHSSQVKPDNNDMNEGIIGKDIGLTKISVPAIGDAVFFL